MEKILLEALAGISYEGVILIRAVLFQGESDNAIST